LEQRRRDYEADMRRRGLDPNRPDLPPGPSDLRPVVEEAQDGPEAQMTRFAHKLSASLWNKYKSSARPAGGAPVVIQQPMVPQVISGIAPGASKKTAAEKAGIVIKQNVKQVVNERKRRKKSSQTADKRSVVNRKKEYNALKKELKKRFTELKREKFKSGSAEIKKLPPKERKAARASLKKELTDKLRALISKMPSATKKSAGELEKLIGIIKRLKW